MSRYKILGIFAAIAFAIVAGLLTGQTSPYYDIYDIVGQLFLNALKLVIVPLVVSSIIIGIARMGEGESVKSLGLKTFGFYLITCFCATLVGYLFVTVMEPGYLEEPLVSSQPINVTEGAPSAKIKEIILKIVPPNVIQAAAEGQMLGLIVFCLLFGYFTSKIDASLSTPMLTFWRAVFQVMMKITHFVMKFLPIGVFALVAKVVASTGFDTIKTAGWFFATVVLALGAYMFIVLPLFLKFVGGVSPLKQLKAMGPALITAFTTSSSAATLPVTLECLEQRAGVSNRIASFTLPLGTSIHLAGSALHECVAVLFIAQVYGIALPFATQAIIVFLAFLTSLGLAGIPSASIVAIVVILNMMGLPLEGLAIVLAVDRIVDMFRTAVNVFSNSVTSVLVARSEGEQTQVV